MMPGQPDPASAEALDGIIDVLARGLKDQDERHFRTGIRGPGRIVTPSVDAPPGAAAAALTLVALVRRGDWAAAYRLLGSLTQSGDWQELAMLLASAADLRQLAAACSPDHEDQAA